MSEFKLAMIITFGMLFIGCIFCFSIEKYSCKRVGKAFNYKYDYSIWTGCILTDNNGKKFLLEQLRKVE